ncbi:MAG: hypothetical protein HC888_00735 [Candidatus Competibacteraceae bacterium]|nr:hypothetical protein [Candidatus Competibacteraceae bacterium]
MIKFLAFYLLLPVSPQNAHLDSDSFRLREESWRETSTLFAWASSNPGIDFNLRRKKKLEEVSEVATFLYATYLIYSSCEYGVITITPEVEEMVEISVIYDNVHLLLGDQFVVSFTENKSLIWIVIIRELKKKEKR